MKILSKIGNCTHVTINTLGNIRSKTHFLHMLAQKSFAVDKLVSVTSILPPRVINKCLMCNRTQLNPVAEKQVYIFADGKISYK